MTAIKRSKILALGYYGIPTKLMDDLAAVLKRVRAEFNGTVLLDTSSSVESTLDDLSRSLPFVDFFIPSHIEGETLTGRTEPNEIIDAFRRAGAAKVVGVKLGGDGCVLDDGTQRVRVPAIPVAKVVDTTGAGDSFLAGIIAAQIHGMNLEQSARFANAVGSCCVQALGASTGIRSFEETRALIR